MYAKIISGGVVGVHACLVAVEVDIDRGLPSFSMVGSLDGKVREARERVSVALKNAGFSMPVSRITVNFSPADLRKEGTAYDLPMAVGILQAMDYFPKKASEGILFLGELGLNGELKKVRGVLPIVREAVRRGITQCIIPSANAPEGAVIPEITVRGAENISQVVAFLQQEDEKKQEKILARQTVNVEELFAQSQETYLDFAEVNGQEAAKRAAQIAAAGFHNFLMTGPPGVGKSMIAKRIPGILPALTLKESLEVTEIFSVAGLLKEGQALVCARPFQNPHHTATKAALTGGGNHPRPGAVSLAHRGILFLDELPEFERSATDSMREPLEEHCVRITRTGGTIVYPSDFMLICAMNPCPCGYYPDRNRCKCTQAKRIQYTGRVSGPVLDRIDLWVELQPVDPCKLQKKGSGEDSAKMKERVERARALQRKRFQNTKYRFNADIEPSDMERYCLLGGEESKMMETLYHTMKLSARAYHRILKVARTIADLEEEDSISVEHLLEAASYRPQYGTDTSQE